MNDLIDKILELFKEQCPNVEYRLDNKDEMTILVKDENGFEIFIQQGDRENTIHFGSWHFHFDNTKDGKNELLDYLGLGMSKLGRLKTYVKNGKEYKWTFETLNPEDGNWYPSGTMGLPNMNFFTKPQIKFYQNNLLDIKRNEV